jgi:hypothetical protein
MVTAGHSPPCRQSALVARTLRLTPRPPCHTLHAHYAPRIYLHPLTSIAVVMSSVVFGTYVAIRLVAFCFESSYGPWWFLLLLLVPINQTPMPNILE